MKKQKSKFKKQNVLWLCLFRTTFAQYCKSSENDDSGNTALGKLYGLINKSGAGLTLIETLVAISILLMSVVAPMVIYSRSISDARYAGDQITAYYLAQEAIEFVKFQIATNLNSGTNWYDPFGKPSVDCISFGGSKKCTVDSIKRNFDKCNTPGSCKLEFSNGRYLTDKNCTTPSCEPTIFAREVAISMRGGVTYDFLLQATVFWTRAGVTKSITIEEDIFNWR